MGDVNRVYGVDHKLYHVFHLRLVGVIKLIKGFETGNISGFYAYLFSRVYSV